MEEDDEEKQKAEEDDEEKKKEEADDEEKNVPHFAATAGREKNAYKPSRLLPNAIPSHPNQPRTAIDWQGESDEGELTRHVPEERLFIYFAGRGFLNTLGE
ncbi:hypothetical protein ACOMHN_032350 [Nucella lapillus]